MPDSPVPIRPDAHGMGRYAHRVLKVNCPNARAIIPKILMELGYTRLATGRPWRCTMTARDDAGTHVLLVVDLAELSRPGYGQRAYPTPKLTPARIEALKTSAATWLFDKPDADSIRIDYLVLPERISRHDGVATVPITYRRGVVWHHSSYLRPQASL